jgi:hypothetical protein
MDELAIRSWHVVGHNRVVGDLYNHPEKVNGTRIVTSAVVEVQFKGTPSIPMAVTRSGTAYWLGEPARGFNVKAAEEFVHRMSRAKSQEADPDASTLPTVALVTDNKAPVHPPERTRAVPLEEVGRWRRSA